MPSRESASITAEARKRIYAYLALSAQIILLTAYLLVPYLAHSDALQWDAVGHVFQSWFIKEYLFPALTGWNFFFFAGYPQGTFYPPLFHYGTACLAFLLGVKLAFKALVSLAVLALVPSAYYFARACHAKRISAATASAGVTTLMAAPIVYSLGNNNIGGTFLSTFNTGLVTNAAALPLFFLYCGALLKAERNYNLLWPSLLLALLILTHTLSTIAAGLFALCCLSLQLRNLRIIRLHILHYGLTLLLTAFWIIPFLVYLPFTETVKISLRLAPGGLLIEILGIILVISGIIKDRLSYAPAIYFLLLTSVLLTINLLNIPFHVYRLILFAIIMIPLFVVQFLNPEKHGYLLAALMVFLVYCLASNNIAVYGPKMPELTFNRQAFKNRTWVVIPPSDENSPHLLQHVIPTRFRVASLKGLFVESSPNARFILSTEKLLDQHSMVWGVPTMITKDLPKETKRNILARMLRIYGINSVLSTHTLPLLKNTVTRPAFSYDKARPHFKL
ncbi:MAG: hypothetical protein D6719_08460, partial [Candidatus Dadabacteria bacterium]